MRYGDWLLEDSEHLTDTGVGTHNQSLGRHDNVMRSTTFTTTNGTETCKRVLFPSSGSEIYGIMTTLAKMRISEKRAHKYNCKESVTLVAA